MSNPYHEFHTHVTALEDEIDRLHLGRLRDQTQAEVLSKIGICRVLLDRLETLTPHVALDGKSQRRIEREQAQAQRKQQEEIK